MLRTLRSVRSQPPTLFSSPLQYQIGRRNSRLRFQQPATVANQSQETNNKMEKQQQKPEQTNNRNAKPGDVMSDSFGEGYATRSDEEGFGGTYGGNDSFAKQEQLDKNKIIHDNHPEYDKSQGSEVAEKEKARHQKTAEG
ncbi:uncharacterized protein LOC130783350 [Actinidia eriantha]|uniref:uncharacterized protein LOC130783350 n=1 Tax=Actinidia eriantha TaxID=165200 RepID=UPI002585A6CE|nr:uncharacterized protein LOC130783350 [Actinidia eriantha]